MKRQIIILLMIALMVVVIPTETSAEILSIETLESSYYKSGDNIYLKWRGIIDSSISYDTVHVYVEFNHTGDNVESYGFNMLYGNLRQGQTDYTFRTSAIDDDYYNVSDVLEKYSYIAELFISYGNEDEDPMNSIYNNSIIHIPINFNNIDYYNTTFEYTNYETITNVVMQTEYTTITESYDNTDTPNNDINGIILFFVIAAISLYLLVNFGLKKLDEYNEEITEDTPIIESKIIKKNKELEKQKQENSIVSTPRSRYTPQKNYTSHKWYGEEQSRTSVTIGKCKACDNTNPVSSKWCMNCGTIL